MGLVEQFLAAPLRWKVGAVAGAAGFDLLLWALAWAADACLR